MYDCQKLLSFFIAGMYNAYCLHVASAVPRLRMNSGRESADPRVLPLNFSRGRFHQRHIVPRVPHFRTFAYSVILGR